MIKFVFVPLRELHQPLRWFSRTVVFMLFLSLSGCGRPPQVVDDEECFQAVDALWTAVTSKRTELLEQTSTELDRLHTAGRLSDGGHQALTAIVRDARSKEWTKAATNLKHFMQGQRRSRPN
jgi:hypothetical protein